MFKKYKKSNVNGDGDSDNELTNGEENYMVKWVLFDKIVVLTFDSSSDTFEQSGQQTFDKADWTHHHELHPASKTNQTQGMAAISFKNVFQKKKSIWREIVLTLFLPSHNSIVGKKTSSLFKQYLRDLGGFLEQLHTSHTSHTC